MLRRGYYECLKQAKMGYSKADATVLTILCAVSYVGIIYLPFNKVSLRQRRDNPVIIRRRLISVVILSVFWLICVPLYLTYSEASSSFIHAVSLLGIVPGLKHGHDSYYFSFKHFAAYFQDFGKAAILISCLYMAPLLNELLFETDYYGNRSDLLQSIIDELKTIQGLRNLVIAPLSEEIIYRSCILTALIPLNKLGIDALVFYTPFYFGIAHFHHAYELYVDHRHSLVSILLTCLFQMVYTTLFGIFATFLFLRTGNTLSISFVHGFCNYFGLPLSPSGSVRWWNHLYYALLVVGLICFKYLLFPLTASINAPIHWH